MRDPLKQLRNCSTISQNQDFLVFQGKKVFSLRRDGTCMTHYPEIHPHAGKSVFLPNNRLLIQGGSDHCYHVLSLEDGKTLASMKLPRQRIGTTKRFALSPDRKTAYDFWELRGIKYIVRINLQTFSYETFPFQLTLRVMVNIACAPSGEVLILESALGSVNGKARTIHQLSSVQFRDGVCESSCKYRWDAPVRMNAHYADDRYALNKNLKVHDLQTNQEIDLLENTELPFTQKNGFLGYRYYPEEQYLQIYDGDQNDFIDCRERKLVARYNTSGNRFIGCLVDGEFWIGTETQIIKKPFPFFEEISP